MYWDKGRNLRDKYLKMWINKTKDTIREQTEVVLSFWLIDLFKINSDARQSVMDFEAY